MFYFSRVHSHCGATFMVKKKKQNKTAIATFIYICDGDNLGIISENAN